MTRNRSFVIGIVCVLAAATVLRVLWLRSDPPVHGRVGIVWHDEGPWVHNARNEALWGQWQTDNWNPVYVTPVFTALEYVAFRELGVGTEQARVVPVLSGLAAVVFLVAGLFTLGSRRAALMGGALIATDYVFVMWNRAALIESTMVAFIVVAWGAYALGAKRRAWALVAGAAASLAYFTKASAAFFAAAVALDAVCTLVVARAPGLRRRFGITEPDRATAQGAAWTLAGLAAMTTAIVVLFVWPHWRDYYFYNVTMSIERKPSYSISDLVDRASWLPIVQNYFTRNWLIFVTALVALATIVARWRSAKPAERLLVLWVILGLAELVLHDSGNQRRYVMFLPAIAGLAALFLGRSDGPLPTTITAPPFRTRFLAAPLLLVLGYLAAGATLQILLTRDIEAGVFRTAVRLSALAAVALTGFVIWAWQPLIAMLRRGPIARGLAGAIVAISVVWNVYEYADWARQRSEFNYRASVALGEKLPPGTLVQGKLANGLSLDNRIRPIFIGNHFGNYDDRLQRDDVRYILTYDLPELGYESQHLSGLIPELLNHYPNRRIVASFDVDETPMRDHAILVDKFPDR
jgi:4-amino-4-deoxy-L-arabinose transferase-like glycosyltransferase